DLPAIRQSHQQISRAAGDVVVGDDVRIGAVHFHNNTTSGADFLEVLAVVVILIVLIVGTIGVHLSPRSPRSARHIMLLEKPPEEVIRTSAGSLDRLVNLNLHDAGVDHFCDVAKHGGKVFDVL